MDPIHARFAARDPLFYDSPAADAADTGDAQRQYAPSASVSWGAWRRRRRHPWSVWIPDGHHLGEQGWKVHVSALPGRARRVLAIVSEHCHRTGMPFKHLSDERALDAVLAKDADRSSAGKFITLYPDSLDALEHCLVTLDAVLGGEPGPYILSDLRWNRGPLYVRYGAFTAREAIVDGRPVPAVRDPRTGSWVADRREAGFHVPPWVVLPSFLQRQLDALGTNPPAAFPEITGALHYSNAGGVYTGVLDGTPVIVKEARPFAGWTADGRDAVARLRDEEGALRAVSHRVRVPAVHATFEAHGHRFLALEKLPGSALDRLVASTSPLLAAVSSRAARDAYRDRMLRVLGSLRTEVANLHGTGRTHGDLHPANVIVGEDGSVGLVDLEMSLPTNASEKAVLGAVGFAAAGETDPVKRDLYACAAIELYVFVPLTPLLGVAPTKAEELVAEAAAVFDLPDSWAARVTGELRRGSAAPRRMLARSRVEPDPAASAQRIAAQLIADATPARPDRLWPGDPRQFSQPAFALAHGALGVAVALDAAGVALPPAFEEWVRRALAATDDHPARLGLMDGAAGALWACRRLGLLDMAARLRERLRDADLSGSGPDLFSGLPGIALALLDGVGDHGVGDDDALERAVTIVEQLADHWRKVDPPTTVARGRGGLMGAATGTALLALRVYERTGDRRFLDTVRRALEVDLRSLRRDDSGALQVDEGWRMMPYLAHGSAGIGLVLAQYLVHEPGDDALRRILGGIAAAASAPFVVQSGLFQGRAGLVLFLGALESTGHATADTDRALEHHLSRMPLHALPGPAGPRFAGDGLVRASCDLATGSAGVLAALVAASGFGDDRSVMPFLLPPVLEPAGRSGAMKPRG